MIRSLVVLVTAMSMMVAFAPGAAAWEPVDGALFNNPTAKKPAKWRLINHVNKAVNRARPGSRILISTFLMDSKASADALIAARKRGVRVQLVMDGDDAYTGQGRRLARVLNRDNPSERPLDDGGSPVSDEAWAETKWGPDKSFVVFCKGSCRAGRANNHSKFYVFSHTGTARDVVMVSSSNLNRGGAVRGWNDLYVAKGKRQLVKQLTGVHDEMAKDTPRAGGDGFRELLSGRYLSRFYPKLSGSDPVLDDLAKVRCRGAHGGAGRNGRTAINVSMFAWNSHRGMQIARRLVELDGKGCDVSVIYGAPSAQVRDLLRKSARRGGIKLWDSRFDRNGDGYFDLRVHYKYMLINGRYGADRSSWRVHTGSQNWGRGTLRGGDENTLHIIHRRAYRQYMKNWNFVRRYGARRIGR